MGCSLVYGKANRKTIRSHRLEICCELTKVMTESNSASAALNKWLKTVAGANYVIHSLRHSMRDRLRAVNCPADMVDQIGGWRKKSVGEGYGEGYSLKVISQILLQTLKTSDKCLG